LVINLSPTPGDVERFTGTGSRQKLRKQVENSALRRLPLQICPDRLVLVGVAADPLSNPETIVADAWLVHIEMRAR
jgi:hypothetical protein